MEAAAISSALAGHQHIERVPDTGPYAAQHAFLEHFMAEMDEMHDDPRAAPRRFSEVVAHALQAPRPHTRYVVGGGSRLLDAVAHLPEAAQDRAIERAVRHSVAGDA